MASSIMVVVSPAGTRTPRVLLFLYAVAGCILLSLPHHVAVAASPLSFSFDFANTSSYSLQDLRFEGSAAQHDNLVDLTCSSKEQSMFNCTGRMSYNHPVPFYDNTTGEVASFTTQFTFAIRLINGVHKGDGVAFFLSGYPSTLPPRSRGSYLGLMNGGEPAGSGRFVAVEFDTYANLWDPPGTSDHIGIDISSVDSVKTTTLANFSLNGSMTASITFNSSTRMLAASLHFNNDDPSLGPAQVKTQLPDPLSSLLPPEVAVGFSASTGGSFELHQIVSWSFSSTLARKGSNAHKSKLLIIAMATPLLPILLCFIFFFVWMRRKGKANLQEQAATNWLEDDALVWRLEEKGNSEFTLFDFSEIQDATGNFAEENRLGQGGFGPVYKGQLPDGLEVAVKRLASHSEQGFTEFKNEVELIAKLQHNNLVKLLGCCIQGAEKILVYEYLPNKSLDFFIFGGNRTLLDWSKRRAIIEGIAQGLLYLHKHSRLRVIHRDLKASNILLDQDMNPKISDFGLAKIFSSNDTQGSTKRVMGTYGYMPPEYASKGIYSIKSDVFSFGVLLLEILSGQRNSGFHQYDDFLNLLGYSWQLWEGGRWLELVEASIAEEIHIAEAKKFINIALMCVQENADDRPTMSEVVAMLNSETAVLPEPNHPAYFNLRVSKVHESATAVDPCSINDVTITVEPDGR